MRTEPKGERLPPAPPISQVRRHHVHKLPQLLVILATMLSLLTAQTCVLPSLSIYLSEVRVPFLARLTLLEPVPSLISWLVQFKASSVLLGYCLAATCFGELCTARVFSLLLEQNSRDPVLVALTVNAVAMVLHGVASSAYMVLASRFLVGCAGGIQWGLLDLAMAQAEPKQRRDIVVSLHSGAYTIAFIFGMGISAVASFAHMTPPGFSNINHMLPGMIDSNGTQSKPSKEHHIASVASYTIGSMEIKPNGGHRRMLLASVNDQLGLLLAPGSTSKDESLGHWLLSPSDASWAGLDDRVLLSKGAAETKAGLASMLSPIAGHKNVSASVSPLVRAVVRKRERAHAQATETDRTVKAFNDQIKAATQTISNINADVKAASQTFSRMKVKQTLGLGVVHQNAQKQPEQTDSEISRKIGAHMYMPSYLTAVVGHGIAAPAYLSALLSVSTAVMAFSVLTTTPSRLSSMPATVMGPRGLRPLVSMIGVVALQVLAQVFIVSVETVVAVTTNVYFGWLIDASAVFMLGIAASGVIGLAVAEAYCPRMGVHRTFVSCGTMVVLGFAVCIPWFGNLYTWQYGFGCCLCAFGAVPMSAFAEKVFVANAVAHHGEDSECGWLISFWRVTGTPVRMLAPIAMGYAIAQNEGAAPNYMGMALLALLCMVIYLISRKRTSELDEWREADGVGGGGGRSQPYSVLKGGQGGLYGSFPPNV